MAKPSYRRTVGNPVIAAIDIGSLALGSYALNHLFNKTKLPPHLEGGGHFQFLTNLSLIFSLVVFGLGALAHLSKSVPLYNLKNSLHPIALVLETIVTSVYWPLRLFFIQHLVKDPNREFIPVFIDLCLHLMPVTALLIDYFVFMPRWTITTRNALSSIFVLTSLYWLLLKKLIDFENGGEYPYAFLNVKDDHTRAVIFAIVGSLGFVFFLIIKKLFDLVVGLESEHVKEE